MRATIKVKNAEVKINSLSNEPYFTANVNGREYIGSVFMINDYISVLFARNINSEKRTTLRIMMAIENKLNN